MEELAPTGVGSALYPPVLEPAWPGSCPSLPGKPTGGSFLNFPPPCRSLEKEERDISGCKNNVFCSQVEREDERQGGRERE